MFCLPIEFIEGCFSDNLLYRKKWMNYRLHSLINLWIASAVHGCGPPKHASTIQYTCGLHSGHHFGRLGAGCGYIMVLSGYMHGHDAKQGSMHGGQNGSNSLMLWHTYFGGTGFGLGLLQMHLLAVTVVPVVTVTCLLHVHWFAWISYRIGKIRKTKIQFPMEISKILVELTAMKTPTINKYNFILNVCWYTERTLLPLGLFIG